MPSAERKVVLDAVRNPTANTAVELIRRHAKNPRALISCYNVTKNGEVIPVMATMPAYQNYVEDPDLELHPIVDDIARSSDVVVFSVPLETMQAHQNQAKEREYDQRVIPGSMSAQDASDLINYYGYTDDVEIACIKVAHDGELEKIHARSPSRLASEKDEVGLIVLHYSLQTADMVVVTAPSSSPHGRQRLGGGRKPFLR